MNKIERYIVHIFFLLFVYSCTDKQINEVVNNDPISTDHNSISVIGWNIELFPKMDSYTVSEVADIIKHYSPDILALQEINSDNEYFDILDGQLENYQGYIQNNDSWSLAFLYKTDNNFEVISVTEIYPNNSYAFPRPPLILHVIWNNDDLYIINNHFKCCSDGSSFERRVMASQLLDEYIDNFLDDEKVIIIGDLNDSLDDPDDSNAFLSFVNDPDNYIIADWDIAIGIDDYWSFPSYPSHIDHVILTSELANIFNNGNSFVETLLIDIEFYNSWNEYDQMISDHRPMRLVLQP